MVVDYVRFVRSRGDLPASGEQNQAAVVDDLGCVHWQREKGAGEILDADGEAAGREEKATRARGESALSAQAGEGHVVSVQVREVGQERDYHPVSAVVHISEMHVYGR